MLMALSLIFVGVKRYRDVECGGVIRFGRAFLLGLGMAAVAGLIYAIGWEVFLAASGYDFMAEYSASILERMRAEGATAAAIEAKAAEMRALRKATATRCSGCRWSSSRSSRWGCWWRWSRRRC